MTRAATPPGRSAAEASRCISRAAMGVRCSAARRCTVSDARTPSDLARVSRPLEVNATKAAASDAHSRRPLQDVADGVGVTLARDAAIVTQGRDARHHRWHRSIPRTKNEPALGATVTRYAQRKLEPPKPETERHALDLAIVNDSASLGAAVDRRPC
jgi:hypothetical protein